MRWTTLLGFCLAFVSSVTGKAVTQSTGQANQVNYLHVVGLFGTSVANEVGITAKLAALTAMDDINESKNILPGYILNLEAHETQCIPARGVHLLYQALCGENTTTKIMVMGGTCDSVTETTALASVKYNLVQVSHAASSPVLSDKTRFEWFFRLVASESVKNDIYIFLFKKFRWDTITAVQGGERLFSMTVNDLTEKLTKNNMKLNGTLLFETDTTLAVEILKRNDARIIFFSAYENYARQACCMAYKLNYYGPKYVWMFPGFYRRYWFDVNDTDCTVEQLLKVLDGYFFARDVHTTTDVKDEGIGSTLEKYTSQLNIAAMNVTRNKNSGSLPGEDTAPMAYDTLWAIALALNATLTDYIKNGSAADVLTKFTYDLKNPMGLRIYENMQKVQFRGLTGPISFTGQGDRYPYIRLQQFRVTENDPGGRIPYSSRRTLYVITSVHETLYTVLFLLVVLGECLSLCFLFFNIKHRHVRRIKLSSPGVNNLTLVGCMLVYATIILKDVGSDDEINIMCRVQLYCLVLGSSLLYGSLFAKTWRVYKIMTTSNKSAEDSKSVPDKSLVRTALTYAYFNMCVCAAWEAVDPLYFNAEDIPESEVLRENDWFEVQQLMVCQSSNQLAFLVVLVIVQGLGTLFGAFLAHQTRKVAYTDLNDSTTVGYCIYIYLCGLVFLGGIYSLTGSMSPDMFYGVVSAIIILMTAVTQCLLFVPKMIGLYKTKKADKEQALRLKKPYASQSAVPASFFPAQPEIDGPTKKEPAQPEIDGPTKKELPERSPSVSVDRKRTTSNLHLPISSGTLENAEIRSRHLPST